MNSGEFRYLWESCCTQPAVDMSSRKDRQRERSDGLNEVSKVSRVRGTTTGTGSERGIKMGGAEICRYYSSIHIIGDEVKAARSVCPA